MKSILVRIADEFGEPTTSLETLLKPTRTEDRGSEYVHTFVIEVHECKYPQYEKLCREERETSELF